MRILRTDQIDEQKPPHMLWIPLQDLHEEGVEIECQADGSNDPAKLEDGIFIPDRLLKESEATDK